MNAALRTSRHEAYSSKETASLRRCTSVTREDAPADDDDGEGEQYPDAYVRGDGR